MHKTVVYLAKTLNFHCDWVWPPGPIAPPNACWDQDKVPPINTKFGGVIDLILKTILCFFEKFLPNRKSAILDCVREFQFLQLFA